MDRESNPTHRYLLAVWKRMRYGIRVAPCMVLHHISDLVRRGFDCQHLSWSFDALTGIHQTPLERFWRIKGHSFRFASAVVVTARLEAVTVAVAGCKHVGNLRIAGWRELVVYCRIIRGLRGKSGDDLTVVFSALSLSSV